MIEKVFEEAGYRGPKHQKKWIALVNGNKPQIRILRRMAKDKGIDRALYAGGIMPPTLKSRQTRKRNHLKAVK